MIVLWVGLFAACGPSPRERAIGIIHRAGEAAAEGDTVSALQRLDSVILFFPKATLQAGIARNMREELYRQIIERKKEQLDSTAGIIQSLEENFRKEKTEFDTYVQYIHKRQTFNRSWDRSFLQVNLDERGELNLTSHYMGKEWMYHTAIRVYDDTLQQKSGSVPLDDPDNRRSDFLDYKWEKVTYRNGKSDSVIQFISDHAERKLKCVFQGKQYYYILLEDYDIEAVKDALALSLAIRQKKNLNTEIARLESDRRKIPAFQP